MPADSWPRCWRARRPRKRNGAAPVPWSDTPTTPQNSRGGMARPIAGGGPPVVPTELRVLSRALSPAPASAEEGGEALGRLLLGDALFLFLLLFLLLALAVLLLGRDRRGRGGRERLGLREDLAEVDAFERGEERLHPGGVGGDPRRAQDPGEGLLIDRLAGCIEQQRTIHVLHCSHSVDSGGTLSDPSSGRPPRPRASLSRRAVRSFPS